MEKEIEINGITYVQKDDTKKKDIVGVMDANLSMIFHIKDEYLEALDDEEIMTLPNPSLTFKSNGTLDDFTMNYGAESLRSKNGTKISKDIVKYASRLIHALDWESSLKEIPFAVYEGWDKETKEFKKDYPIVLRSGQYGVVVAPRVEND